MEKIKFLSIGLMLFLLNVQIEEFQNSLQLEEKFSQEQLIRAYEEQNRLIDQYEPQFARYQGLLYTNPKAYDKALGRYIVRKEKKRLRKGVEIVKRED